MIRMSDKNEKIQGVSVFIPKIHMIQYENISRFYECGIRDNKYNPNKESTTDINKVTCKQCLYAIKHKDDPGKIQFSKKKRPFYR